MWALLHHGGRTAVLGARRASEMENHYRRASMIIIMPPAKQVRKDDVSEPVKSSATAALQPAHRSTYRTFVAYASSRCFAA